MAEIIKERISRLRKFMQAHGISAFIVPGTDPHSGEYVPAHWECRKWISGFTGSAGTVVVTLDQAGLWTDSRYFLQAGQQLQDSGITLFKERMPDTPDIAGWLSKVLPSSSKVGIDGSVNSWEFADYLQKRLQPHQIEVVATPDPFTELWEDRPGIPTETVRILPLSYAGIDAGQKMEQIRSFLCEQHAEGILISALDEIAWTLNLRGKDISYNPVFISYLLITRHAACLYILSEKLTPEVTDYLNRLQVQIRDYRKITDDLSQLHAVSMLLTPSANYAIYRSLAAHCQDIRLVASPVSMLKAVKNPTEIEGFHQAMIRDGVAMVRFIKWLKESVGTGALTELSIDEQLTEFRAAQPLFQGLSFETIAGYQAHGAIVHYAATPESASPLKPEGLLLLDSGAQYLDGTTDITRTFALGPVTMEQKTDYTLVLKGMIALSQAEFPHGTCGTQLDVLARQFMWKEGINYGHGTGHGVGHFLCVHEGPHQIRMNHIPALLLPGMTVTNEPGIYRAGAYGIRIENTMMVTESRQTDFGTFYRFEPLTLCPIDTEPIRTDLLSEDEINWLNGYHQLVFEKISPLLDSEESEWLRQATRPIVRNS